MVASNPDTPRGNELGRWKVPPAVTRFLAMEPPMNEHALDNAVRAWLAAKATRETAERAEKVALDAVYALAG